MFTPETNELFIRPRDARPHPNAISAYALAHRTSDTAHTLVPELFGYDLALAKSESKISTPYLLEFSAYADVAFKTSEMDAALLAAEFAKTHAAHLAIRETVEILQLRFDALSNAAPKGKLTLAQAGAILCASKSVLINALDNASIPFRKEIINATYGGWRPTNVLPANALHQIFTWRYPKSYPQELIPPEHLSRS